MDDTVQSDVIPHCADEGYAGRIDVITGPSGRRRWPVHAKAEIVLQSYRDGCSVADVARKHGVSGLSTDHVHMFLSIPPHLALSTVMQRIKGRSSRKIQMEYPELRKRYWGRRFWA